MVIIGGLGYDDTLTLNLPTLERLQQVGASAAVQSEPPTYTQTSWATIISGAPPDTNDAPLFDRPDETLYRPQIDTIFARAHAAQLKTALLGQVIWRKLVPSEQVDRAYLIDDAGPAADELVYEAALPLIRDETTNLVLLHFSQVDQAVTDQGGVEELPYAQAASQVDSYLAEISAATNLNNAVLIVLGDHGHLASGGHGGSEPEVVWQPLVMVGKNIVPGSYSDIRQADLAPTVAALLGTAPPTAAQGRVLFEMIRLSEPDRALIQQILAQQRLALAEVYPAPLPPARSQLFRENLKRAQVSLENGNINGAYELTKLTQQEIDTFLAVTRHDQLQSAKLPRLPVALLVPLIWLMLMWRRRGPQVASIIAASLVTVGLYHGLYQLQGYSYSISALGDFSDLTFETARRVTVCFLIGGGFLLIFLMLINEIHWGILLGTAYGFSVLSVFLFILPFFWGYWHNGLTVAWPLPDVTAVYWQLSSALETVFAAVLGLLLPWPIMILSLFVNLIRRRLSDNRPRTKPDALPGLRL